MRVQLSIAQDDGTSLDVLADVDDDLPVGRFGAELARVAGVPARGVWLSGMRLDAGQPVGDSDLVDGAVVHLTPGAAASPPRGWQLRVLSGPGSGLVAELPVGEHELGRSGPFGLADPAVSRRHALLRLGADGATLRDLGSANGTTLEGAPVPEDDDVPVAPGQVVQLGDTQLVVGPAPVADAAVEPAGPGTRALVRAPRLLPSAHEVRVQLPQAPTGRDPRRLPWLMVLAPLLVGVVLAAVMRSPLYLVFAVASPVMLIGNTVADRRQSAREQRQERAGHERELARARERIDAAVAEETARRRDAHPDPATALLTAVLPGRRLWERRRTDPDALDLRLGAADLPARVVVDRAGGGEPPEQRTVHAVPVVVPLGEAGVVGLAGPAGPLAGLLRWVVLQLAVTHPPRDLGLTLLAPGGGAGWTWVRWLPHARPADGEGPVALVGTDTETVAARVAELTALVRARRAASTGRALPESFPAHVLVVDGYRALRATPGLAQLLQDGPAVGVYAVCADEEERFLPESATATALLDPADEARLVLRRSGHDPVPAVLAEPVPVELAERAARALAPLRDVAPEDDAVLPGSVRLLDLLGLEPPTADGVRARWQLEGRSTRLVAGAGLHGPFTLDLRTDGPHGLVAGTTGAGKSELLQTVIASLAVANRPDALNLVLVDYKGGSAFEDCVHLPHTVGMVTDLDPHLVRRALTSLRAELTHREHRLADAGVKDVEDYVALQAREPGRPPLPRLLIVIDEFASLARELPEFVTGLVDVAQRGRSLGIHLLLATQRPSGVVSPEIRANTNLRISLRVTDGADSSDVLDAPDAARIAKSAPGRGFARLGHGALVPFQAARIGGRRPGRRSTASPAPSVVPVGWHQLGYAPPRKPATAARASDDEVTDLSVLVGAVRAAAEADGVPAQRSPWLPALPARVPVTDLGAPEGGASPTWLPYGLQDVPATQERRVAAFDPAADGHLLVVGSPKSGRSQLLRTLAGAAGSRCSTADLHLYALDCGNGALLPVADLPHCGAVVTRTQTERAARLLDRLARELERRQQVLAEGGFADVAEQRRSVPAGERLPHVLLMLDRWEGFTPVLGELDGGRLTDVVTALAREGASAGISLVITGDRSLGTGRLSSLTDGRLVMRLADRGDYPLVGVPGRQVPDWLPPGRAVTVEGAVETQVALLGEDASGQGQAAALAAIAEEAHVRDALVPPEARPFRVDVLPARLGFEAAWDLRPADAGPGFALVGVGGDELAAAGPDLVERGPAFVVAGPVRSGRSTLLAVMAESLLRRGSAVVVCAPRPSPLRALAGRPGVLDVVVDAAAPADRWRELLAAEPARPLVLLLDDGEVLRDCPAGEVFRAVVRGEVPGRGLVLGGNADALCTGLSGWQVEVRKVRQGVLLSPQGSTDGDLIGVRVPRGALGGPVRPGRGLLHLGDGALRTIAVPTVP
ncbi:FHA domain-containing protein [Blastococcus sp. MG754426]|uniref:FtsK/SpoIIIE domain-containing protein n=1 Tax=unclassified Blastococcus TaxID=2619396 RepID=UPI001EF11A37|nr:MULTISPECIES: FtsK/SpoIIIE domain-containing protein [unclassified Blastococcus]MCF6509244.1 FHA domain-containing protein [Blastococcus sp. MG754426]MCF6512445.1 FHA domain-containing protein [Blastococcus sp. MG754427]